VLADAIALNETKLSVVFAVIGALQASNVLCCTI